MRRYPTYYYFILILALLLSIVFWWLFLGESSAVQQDPYSRKLRPVDETKIIDDPASNRKIISNLVNIAIKDTAASAAEFIQDFESKYNKNEAKLVHADSLINFFQVEVHAEGRIQFKAAVKNKMAPYDLLVWDEALFNSSASTGFQQNRWHLQTTGLEEVSDWVSAGNVTLAVIDNGFDLQHPALQGRIVKPYNVFTQSADVSPSAKNHGTHVASVAAGAKQGKQQGVCSTCKIMPIKVADWNGNFTSAFVVKSVLYAVRNRADVINMSLGFAPADTNLPPAAQEKLISSGMKDEEQFFTELFAYAARNRAICVLAAGNSTLLTGIDPMQRSPYAINVGAADPREEIAEFSNYGPFTTLFAPGVQIYGAKPNGAYEYQDGTSFAAPLVAGFVGLLKSVNKDYSAAQIRELLLKNTVDINGIKQLRYNTLN